MASQGDADILLGSPDPCPPLGQQVNQSANLPASVKPRDENGEGFKIVNKVFHGVTGLTLSRHLPN